MMNWCNVSSLSQLRGYSETIGKSLSDPMLVQMVDDLWIENSISCTEGCNGRNMVNITKWLFLEIYVYVIESNKVTTNERKNKYGITVFSVNWRMACRVRKNTIQKKC